MDRDTTVTAVTEVQAGHGPARDTVLLGKYRVESTLGFGGMGLVIRAHNIDLDERVAIKLLREDVQVDHENVTRFVREAKNAVKLKSEHVARIRDVGTFEDGRPYMVMELLEGLDLGKMLIDQGKLDRPHAVDLVLQACEAIAEAHSLGIVHRDIKPTNLFVTKRRDGTDLLKVLDFGISKAQVGPDLSLTQTQSMLGTPAYMSPEQMRSARTVDRRSDIWSIGCVLYELVEGVQPFEASNFAELCVMVSIDPFRPLTAAPELTPVIERALAKTADTRFQTVADLAFALEPFASEPERAHREVARIFRLLGRTHPEGRDSTPIPLTQRGDRSQITRPAPGATPIPTLHSSSGRWKWVAFFTVLLGIGIAGGVLVMGASEDAAQPAAGSDEPLAPAVTTNDDANELTVERVDAGAEVMTEALDAGIAETGSAAGSGSANKPARSKPRKPRKPVKPPPKPVPSADTTKPPPPPPPPPKPKCDPFANPKGCN